MTLHLDLDDVAAVAEKELARLRAIEDAAQAVVDRWYATSCNNGPSTVKNIRRLRAALEG